jgi:putative membrane protein
MVIGFLMMLLFWGGLIVLILLAIRWFGRSSAGGEPPPGGRTPLDVLQERFARGEIDRVEFEERRQALSE